MAKSDLRIDILGTSISLSTDEEPGYLDALLSKYREAVENVQRLSGLKDPLKIAILTGFLLCDDLEKAGTAAFAKKDSGELEQITLGMISRLDEMFKVSSDTEMAAASKTNTETATDTAQALPQKLIEPPLCDTRNAEDTPKEPLPPTKAPEESGALSSNNSAPSAPLSRLCEMKPVDPEPAKPEPAGTKPAAFFKLQNTVKNYEWGSTEWLPTLLGRKNLSRIPWAELWMGVHPAGPSRVVLPDEEGPLLSELIDGDPEVFLGKEAAQVFGKLPFLLKVEAAAKPLSIQAHPNQEQARQGFARENRDGIPLDAPNRNYRDPNHKPEILCALSSFVALCGFRELREIKELVDILYLSSEGILQNGLESLVAALEQDENPFKAFLSALFNLNAEARRELGPFIKNSQSLLERDFPEYRDEWNLCAYFSGLYPGDNGIIAPLYLNILELAPGQAIYLPAGVLHAYIHGMGIELMADSDNVLRGGLTSKHMAADELLQILDFSAYRPELLNTPEPAPAWHRYPAPTGEFALSVMHSSGGTVPYTEKNPSIVILTKGSAAVVDHESGAELSLNAGESVFVPAGEKATMAFSGSFTAYAAAVGNNPVGNN